MPITGPFPVTSKTLAEAKAEMLLALELENVDNTSDANKPVSTAAQTALNLKAPIASPTFTGTVAGITKTMVGLANVDNTSDANKPVSTLTQAALDLKQDASVAVISDIVQGGTGSIAITNLVAITEADYNALVTPDADTLYILIEP